ncbi:MAG TPA: glycosyltransferase family 4 protein [Sphingomonas sp.]|nr:glycosyltransferase family 4 protein [Sphingomonas sp.]
MPLTVLSVAYPFAPVTADPAGGSEQVLAQLDRALTEAGHRSIVIAAEGSTALGDLIAIPAPSDDLDHADRESLHALMRARIAEAIAEERVDLIHLHGLDFAAYMPPPGLPLLVTLHLPFDWYPPGSLPSPERPRTWFNPVSADQARRAPPGLDLLPPVANGVDTDLYRPSGERGDYALILGRVAPEKGFADAIEAARIAGAPLIAAGRLFPYDDHRRYFEEQVRPRLDAERRFIGPVEGEAKRRLLAEARCVLIPSTAPETSSLVAMEALACGTPVIAYRAGALPEIVEPGVTGFLVDDIEELAEAIGRTETIDPLVCRSIACERFALDRATGAYLDLYLKLAA